MSYYTEQNIFPSVDRSEWRLWDGSQMKDQNFNTMPFDFGIGTGSGFIAGYDTGGLKVTATDPPSSGLHYNTGVFYCRSSEVGNKIGAYRNYVSETGLYYLHPFDAGNTGWSFVYATADGKIGEYIASNSGDSWTFPTNKVLLAKIARDNVGGTGNAFPQAKISDQRHFIPQCNLYESKSDTGSTLQYHGNVNWDGSSSGRLPIHAHIGTAGDGGCLSWNIVSDTPSENVTLSIGQDITVCSLSITISNASNKIVIMANACVNNANATNNATMYLKDDTTELTMESDPVRCISQIPNGTYAHLGILWSGTLSAGVHTINMVINANAVAMNATAGFSQLIAIEFRTSG